MNSNFITELQKMHKASLFLSARLQEFSDNVCSDNYVNVYDNIVDASVTKIGHSNEYRIPDMYKERALFIRLKYLAVSRHLFSPEDIQAIEAKLGKKMDDCDTIYVKRPTRAGLQELLVIRLVKDGDVVSNKP